MTTERPIDGGPGLDPTAARVEPVAGEALADDVSGASLSGHARLWWQGIRAGELGTLPIILGLGVDRPLGRHASTLPGSTLSLIHIRSCRRS
jgi:hypothetical protein